MEDLDFKAGQGQEYKWEEWMGGLESTVAHAKEEKWEGHQKAGTRRTRTSGGVW